VYISEGRDAQIISALQEVASSHRGATCVWTFKDAAYHRTGFTLASPKPAPLCAAVVALVGAALKCIDLRTHVATHPRLGVVDHISCHPLASTSTLATASETAHQIGRQVGRELNIPVLYYGAAHHSGRRLAEIRRAAGYFKGSAGGVWEGSVNKGEAPLPPDCGPSTVSERSGILCLGAAPWVVNYNIALSTSDLDSARRIARAVSTRGGGPAGVEAMALPHSDGTIEIACNLLDASVTPQEEVLALVSALAEGAGVGVLAGYTTNKQPEELVQIALRQLSGDSDDVVRH